MSTKFKPAPAAALHNKQYKKIKKEIDATFEEVSVEFQVYDVVTDLKEIMIASFGKGNWNVKFLRTQFDILLGKISQIYKQDRKRQKK